MTDTILAYLAALGLGVCLTVAVLDHTRANDARKADLAACRADLAIEGEVANACMAVVEQCRALVEGHACSCWRVSE